MSLNKVHQKYHSAIPLFYIHKMEHLLPKELRDKIPNSTISTWRSTASDSYFGYEYDYISKEAFDQYELMLKYQNLKSVVTVLTSVWIKSSDIFLPILKNTYYRERFVSMAQELNTVMPRKKLLKLFRLSSHQFSYLLTDIKEKCGLSVLNRCFNKHPNQLTQEDVENLKELYRKKEYACWPNSSIYFKGLQESLINYSLTTFYKYIRLLGLKRKFITPKPDWKGCKSTRTNEYFHVDTTFIKKLPSGEKAAIVLLSDNFSRAILGYNLASENGAEFVKKAMEMSIKTVQENHPNLIEKTTLVADGGSENHAACITELISLTKSPIMNKVIALKDVLFSNSQIEAINKIMKRYIRYHKPQSLEELEKLLPEIIHDYNFIRPHLALKGMTPMDVYTNKKQKDYSEQKALARKLRVEQNTKKCCVAF